MSKIVIWHKHCSDGLVAAYSFCKAYPDAEFFAAMHDGSSPPDVAGKEVYIVDFCYAPNVLLEMKKTAKSVVVLDHHKSAMERCGFSSDDDILGGKVVFAGTRLTVSHIGKMLRRLKNDGSQVYREEYKYANREEIKADYPDLTDEQLDLAEICRFDMKRSGAGLAWDYLYPTNEVPWWVSYTQDKDLWKFELPHSREVNAALQSYPLTFKTFDELSTRRVEDLRIEGTTILRANQNMIDSIVNKAREVEICGHKVLCVNSPVLQSEIGNYLCKGKAFAVVYFENEFGEKVYSFRSDSNGVDVSKIVEELGAKFGVSAGGHKHSSGIRISANYDICSIGGTNEKKDNTNK